MHCMMVSIGTGIGASMAKKRIETKGKRTDHYWALPHLDLANHVYCANAQHPNSNSDTPVRLSTACLIVRSGYESTCTCMQESVVCWRFKFRDRLSHFEGSLLLPQAVLESVCPSAQRSRHSFMQPCRTPSFHVATPTDSESRQPAPGSAQFLNYFY
jgi:hypothetical protein